MATPPIQPFQKLPEDTPVIPSLSSRMPIELMVNPAGKAIMLHKEPLVETIWWGEYDVELNSLYFVTVKGQIMGYGMTMPPKMASYMALATMIAFTHVDKDNKPIAVPIPIPLVVRHPDNRP